MNGNIRAIRRQSRLRSFAGRPNAAALGPGHALLFKDQAIVLRNFRESFCRRSIKYVSNQCNTPFRGLKLGACRGLVLLQ